MAQFVVRRLVYGFVTLLALSIVVFLLIQWSGGSPLDRLRLNHRMAAQIPELTEFFGLDRPIVEQYWTWLRKFVTPARFDISGIAPVIAVSLGLAYAGGIRLLAFHSPAWLRFRTASSIAVVSASSWFAKGRVDFALDWSRSFRGDGSVWDLVMGAMGATIRLGSAALILAVVAGIPLGVYQAVRQYSVFDQVWTSLSFTAYATPDFVIGLFSQVVLALYLQQWTGLKVFYVAGMTSVGYESMGRRLRFGAVDLPSLEQLGDIMQHLALPALSLAIVSIAAYARFQRASMLEVMHSDFMRTATAKGLPRWRVLIKHGMRNALIPVVTVVSLSAASVVGGAVIIEEIFGWPGVGRVFLSAVDAVDYPVVMAVVMTGGAAIVVMNVVADILYAVLDPRVRFD